MKDRCIEQIQTIDELEQLGMLTAIIWAIKAGTRQALDDDYRVETGHNRTTLGTDCYILICDRLDRVFSCEKYEQNNFDESGADILYAGLSKDEITSMPKIPPSQVTRSDINGSSGWVINRTRFLLQSFRPGELHQIRWREKGITKQEVAREPFNDMIPPKDGQGMLEIELPKPNKNHASSDKPETTLVIAYSVDEIQNKIEMAIGRSRYIPGERKPKPWHWIELLIENTLPNIATVVPTYLEARSNNVVDPPVRLRKRNNEQKFKEV